MTPYTAINISLHVENQVLDLRIPNHVVRGRLQELLHDVLKEHSAIGLPRRWELKAIGKHVAVGEGAQLKDYPISDGDQFAVIVRDRTEGG